MILFEKELASCAYYYIILLSIVMGTLIDVEYQRELINLECAVSFYISVRSTDAIFFSCSIDLFKYF